MNTRDVVGGAAIAAYRLFRGLLESEINIEFLVDIKKSNDSGVEKLSKGLPNWVRAKIDYFPLRFLKNRSRSVSWISSGIIKRINEIKPEIVHIHWINNGFISIEQLSEITCPIVWTCHDMWAFSDSRHYVGDYEAPEYRSNMILDKWVWRRKRKTYHKIKNLHIVSPSNWLANCSRKSILLGDRHTTVIANGIDIIQFQPMDKTVLRHKYGISPASVVCLFSGFNGTNDKRKGFHYLIEAVRYIMGTSTVDFCVAVVGAYSSTELDELEIKVTYFGDVIDQNIMSEIYALSDLFILPSLQDNLPNTVIEAMACGCPTIAFNVGGIPDMIDHKINGYIAEPKDHEDLASGILWYLNSHKKDVLSEEARKKVIYHFEINQQAAKYIELYKDILNKV